MTRSGSGFVSWSEKQDTRTGPNPFPTIQPVGPRVYGGELATGHELPFDLCESSAGRFGDWLKTQRAGPTPGLKSAGHRGEEEHADEKGRGPHFTRFSPGKKTPIAS
jgi:hypothetical protein